MYIDGIGTCFRCNFMHIYGENIMKNLSFLTLFAFLSVGFVVADEPVDEDVEVVAEATMSESSDAADDEDVQEPVSYTHLTLPTKVTV